MRSNPVDRDGTPGRGHASQDGSLEVSVDGACAYWLGDRNGAPIGPESERTLAPFALALNLVRSGVPLEGLVVWSRLADGQRYRVAGGAALVELAEAAAGIPARPRHHNE
jgi:hypothetical protein